MFVQEHSIINFQEMNYLILMPMKHLWKVNLIIYRAKLQQNYFGSHHKVFTINWILLQEAILAHFHVTKKC
jgi:hypothetical protein